ncbi:MAG: hypothetical protein HZC41_26575 [Chloroflexi bacterium]|nr:hypothetical protein [Chloroflexota bacterium]
MNDLIGLPDTNIVVDFSRKYKPAIEWLRNNEQLVFGVPSLVRMVPGASNRIEQDKVIRLLQPYTIVYPSELDAQWAMEQFEIYHLSHRIEIIDCFIAAMSARLQLPIDTRNVRNLNVFPGVLVHVPY